MKNKKDLSKINSENAREICSKIKEESSEEAQLLLGKACGERERILAESSRDAELRSKAILSAAEKETAQAKDRIFSAANMEKRRIRLEADSLFVADVIGAVRREAEKFRSDKEYVKFLREAVLEGIRIVDDKRVLVLYSGSDEGLISFLKDLPAEFKKGDFDEMGVIVRSQDGRLLLDNRFSARLKRRYDEIYTKLLKEAS